ncbi:hypothetical protein [Enterobacter asburiae]|uniref:hypothetical protein n=1 Tax=Enterobacter asburiae TaxID=61645 RepID=UPI00287EE665|nr:hypothetical protein [Enterobacter asburiae]
MSKQNAVDLARTARSEAESITKGDKRTIAAIITNWNECVKQAGFWCIYDFPTTGYTRKSQLVADLLRCADQLDEYVEPNPHAAQTVEHQTRELNAALNRVLDVEEANAEALDINAWIDDLTQNGVDSKRLDNFCFQIREDDHAEALEMNVGIELALHIITKMVGNVGAGDAAGGCLYRDGFNEINYLVSVALGMYEKRETEHAEAIEEDKRFTWLANRWSLFWAGCDYFTRRTMIEEAHAEALRIDAEQYAAPVTCSIFQRNDGVQLALDSSCDVRFIRTSKSGEWFKAGFRNTDIEGYQPVESDVLFTSMPSRTLSYSDGVMVVSEA